MSTVLPRILVTAATGQLGRLVTLKLLESVSADRIVVAVRNPAKAADLAGRGVTVRRADYDQVETLDPAFAGVDKLLLISTSDLGNRVRQHTNAINAAKRAGVRLIAYTSLLRADTSTLRALADEHEATEKALVQSGAAFVILRNGWYTENRAMVIPSALEHGVIYGAAGEGRFSFAARADYADAAAAVLAGEGHAGRTYELAGDSAVTLTQFAAEVATQTGKPMIYKNLTEADYAAALASHGLPPAFAKVLAQADTAAANGELFESGHDLSRLIGRPTTPVSLTIASALRGNSSASSH